MADAGPTIQELMGGFLIEIFVALTLYGITIAQTYVYALNSSEDPWLLKFTVGAVAILETAHSIFAVHMVYVYAITDFGQLESIGNIVWSAGACVASGMIIVAFVQGFYIRRIYILSKRNWWLTSLVGGMLFLRISFGLATSGLTFSLGTWGVFRAKTGPLFTLSTGLGLSALVDLMVALTLMFYLHRSRTGFRDTDHLIHKLMAYAVNTGFITMICSVAIVLTFVFLKTSLLFAGLVQMSSKLYANSLLGTLNARQILRKQATQFKSSELSDRFQTKSGPTVQRHIEIFQETSKITSNGLGYPAARRSSNYVVGEEAVIGKFDSFAP